MVDTAQLVRWLVGEVRGPVCRVCYAEVGAQGVALQDEVGLSGGGDGDEEVVTMRDIISTVAGIQINEEMLLDTVCQSCFRAAVASFAFRRLCRGSSEKLHAALARLGRCQSTRAPSSRASATGYLLLEHDRVSMLYDRRRPTEKVQALARALALADAKEARSEKPKSELNRYQCEDCGRTFAREGALAKHAATHTVRHMCSLCTKAYASRGKLAEHVARAHNDKTHRCAECPKRFGSRFLAEEHRKAMHTHLECGVCGETFTNKHKYRAHALGHGRRWPCLCGKTFKYKEGLKRHEVRCSGHAWERFVCDHCSKSYSSKGTLVQHVRYAHGADPLRCAHCSRKFQDAGKLRCHVSSHTGVKHFECEMCGVRFSYSTTLQYHMRAFHTGERPYGCDECAQSFITSSVRLVHKRRYHGAPRPACHLCGATFVTNFQLRKHMRKHTDVAPS